MTNTVRKAVLAPLPTDISLPGELEFRPANSAPREERHETLLQVYQQYFISANRAPSPFPSDPPTITISHTVPSGTTQHLASISSSRLSDFYSSRPDFRPPLSISKLRLDESAPFSPSSSILLSVFYSTGQFSIFRLFFPTTTTPFHFEEVHTSLSLSSSIYTHSSTTPFDSVSLAKLHYPLLVTCSKSFTLRFYQLSTTKEGGLEVRETETPLQSRERWAPVVLSLEKVRSRNKERSFKVCLAYSLPVFPNNWTVGLQGSSSLSSSFLRLKLTNFFRTSRIHHFPSRLSLLSSVHLRPLRSLTSDLHPPPRSSSFPSLLSHPSPFLTSHFNRVFLTLHSNLPRKQHHLSLLRLSQLSKTRDPTRENLVWTYRQGWKCSYHSI